MDKELVFLCGARDFHAMDWYKSAKTFINLNKLWIVTDLIAAEGYKKIISSDDKVYKLFILDAFLFKKQSTLGHYWRNLLKLMVFPLQVLLLKKFSKKHPNAVYHAHSMYYIFLAWATNLKYVATPQGSDVLIKPKKSRLYKYFTIKSLKKAKAITVDSVAMQNGVFEMCGIKPELIQNGIDIESITAFKKKNYKEETRFRYLSIRGFTELYRIGLILKTRNESVLVNKTPITFIYPFADLEYKNKIIPMLGDQDSDLGRIDRIMMYEILLQTKLVFSIPISDSSPRSVYEAIFCGCAVAITYHPYYDTLPDCMKKRIIILDLSLPNWFDIAIEKAEQIITEPFNPTSIALNLFDQKKSFKQIETLLFNS